MVVQGVDAKEQHYVDEPTLEGHLVRSDEQGRSGLVELGDVARHGDEEELDKGQEGAAGRLDSVGRTTISTCAKLQPAAGGGVSGQERDGGALRGTDWMMASKAKTLEQHPPKIRASMAPTASHWGMVSMKMRPSMPMILEDIGRWSSMPCISAFSREGAALITRGVIGAEAAACCWAFWREEGCRRRVGRVVIYTGLWVEDGRAKGGWGECPVGGGWNTRRDSTCFVRIRQGRLDGRPQSTGETQLSIQLSAQRQCEGICWSCFCADGSREGTSGRGCSMCRSCLWRFGGVRGKETGRGGNK